MLSSLKDIAMIRVSDVSLTESGRKDVSLFGGQGRSFDVPSFPYSLPSFLFPFTLPERDRGRGRGLIQWFGGINKP